MAYLLINAFQNNREEKAAKNCPSAMPSIEYKESRGSSWENRKIVDFTRRNWFVQTVLFHSPSKVRMLWSLRLQSSRKVSRTSGVGMQAHCTLDPWDPGRRSGLPGGDLHRNQGCHSLLLCVAYLVWHRIISSSNFEIYLNHDGVISSEILAGKLRK